MFFRVTLTSRGNLWPCLNVEMLNANLGRPGFATLTTAVWYHSSGSLIEWTCAQCSPRLFDNLTCGNEDRFQFPRPGRPRCSICAYEYVLTRWALLTYPMVWSKGSPYRIMIISKVLLVGSANRPVTPLGAV